ncbi:MAG: valine--tRNA ligase [Solirubrobacterales bacterium]
MDDDRLQVLNERTRYEPGEAEQRIFDRWIESGIFHPEDDGTPAENYSIVIPPPNVTGALHMGHALNGSIQDTLIRLRRMQGRRAKWVLGTDHAGIATQAQVEKLLAKEGTSRRELGREAFERRVWEWREQYGATIIGQFKRLGASCDYGEEHFTMDPEYAKAVVKVFVALYEKGLIYRDNYMINWDPGIGSAISDLEVEDIEVEGAIYDIKYPLEGGGELTVATTRPETMLADTAVAVNPGDERYGHLVGSFVILPIVGRRLPVIADQHVDLEFGTGVLKITPGHDPNDFEIGRRHGLDELTVIGFDGLMNEAAGEFAGLEVLDARERIVERLRELGALGEVKPHTHVVPHSQRSGARIEPLISLQWFCDMRQLAGPAIEAVETGKVRFVPDRWGRVYLNWMNEIRPWCVSRQLWWGHRLPVWYRGEELYVGETEPDGDGWTREEDVLDTWFSSALWPFATMGWPGDTGQLKAYYPTDVLSTARDIIFLWVARMIMMGIEFLGEVPFDDVYIHSVIQAPDGRRMSKSLGTGIDPLEQIDEYGADATRFGLLAMSSAQDVRYSVEKVKQGSDLANKLWNASRLILLKVADVPARPCPETPEDRWILSRLQGTIAATTDRIEAYDFSHAALGLYDFFYNELCDWYLEFAKPRLWAEGENDAVSSNLLFVLERTLALMHPIMPFVTEEIWALLPGGRRGLLASSAFPTVDDALVDAGAEGAIDRLIEAITSVRRYRDELGIAPRISLRGRLLAEGYEDGVTDHLERLARIELVTADEPTVGSLAIPGGAIEMLQSEAFDPVAAEAKKAGHARRLEGEIERVERKLGNEQFVAKAPPAVVDAEREKLERFRRELAALVQPAS